jgi:hypothetical protein
LLVQVFKWSLEETSTQEKNLQNLGTSYTTKILMGSSLWTLIRAIKIENGSLPGQEFFCVIILSLRGFKFYRNELKKLEIKNF